MRIATIATAIATVVAGTGVTLAAAPAPAAAAQPGRHCVASVVDASVTCYKTFTEAIAHATGGRLVDAPASAAKALRDPRFESRLNTLATTPHGSSRLADTVIEVASEDTDFEDNSLTITATGRCDDSLDADFELAELSAYWNDEIGSFRAFANCLADHFEHAHFGGRSTGLFSAMADLGDLDDEVSSIRWH